jgi:hypothetical protein
MYKYNTFNIANSVTCTVNCKYRIAATLYCLRTLLQVTNQLTPWSTSSWEASRSSPSQEIPCILWYPNVHSLIHNSPPPVPVPSQTDPVCAPPPLHSTSRRSVLILSYHLCRGLSSGLLPSDSPTKTLYAFLLFPIHVTCPAHLG